MVGPRFLRVSGGAGTAQYLNPKEQDLVEDHGTIVKARLSRLFVLCVPYYGISNSRILGGYEIEESV